MTTINSKSELTLDELDRLCALKVMGWREYPGIPTKWEQPHNPLNGSYRQMDKDLWQPTRNISQAFELIEHSKMWDISFKLERCFDDENYYNCSLLPMVDANVNAETASLAITKACLKAVGVE